MSCSARRDRQDFYWGKSPCGGDAPPTKNPWTRPSKAVENRQEPIVRTQMSSALPLASGSSSGQREVSPFDGVHLKKKQGTRREPTHARPRRRD